MLKDYFNEKWGKKNLNITNSLNCLNRLKSFTQSGVKLKIYEKINTKSKYSVKFTENGNLYDNLCIKNFIFDFSKKYIKTTKLNKSNISLRFPFYNDTFKIKKNYLNASVLYEEDRTTDYGKSNMYEIDFEIMHVYKPLFSSRNLIRKRIRSLYCIKTLFKNNSKLNVSGELIKQIILKTKLNKMFHEDFIKIEKIRYLKFSHFKLNRKVIKIYNSTKDYVVLPLLKKTSYIYDFKRLMYTTYEKDTLLNQYCRHPAAQSNHIMRNITTSFGYGIFFKKKIKDIAENRFSELYKITWRYFKYKIERFFFNHLCVRVHIWFLNIWDIFLNGIDTLWRWYRYEDATSYFLTKKGQQFIVESREGAKFYIRTMTLTLTMVGGVKLFLDNISLMMKRYRNNWAFIIHTTKSLRFCINYFWFRFFVNYKITLQGKIGGFLRAQKKIFKKGNISIENKHSAITYYRGYPVTRFGSYNLSFWLQYRIPNLIEKFEELEYIDTMKILLGMYTIPWLAKRLSKIIQTMLTEHVIKVNRKVSQYNRRIRARKVLIYDALKTKKYFFKKSKISSNSSFRYDKLKKIVLPKSRCNRFFKKSLYKKTLEKISKYSYKKN